MLKKILITLLLLPSIANAVENYKYFMEAQSLKGPTGNINTISTKTLSHKQWSMGLHRFFMGLNYGVLPNFETGLSFNLKDVTPLTSLDKDNVDRKMDEFSLHTKYQLLKEENYPLDITLAQRRDTFYLIAGKYFSQLWDSTLQGGIHLEGDKLLTFFSFSQTKSSEQFIFDYEPKNNQYNLGWRFLLSPEMKLDFFLTDFTRIKNIFFDNFIFGITLAG
ncbi:MAG: hypothetical protein JW871_04175 [Endomicrobiales bacterium]|nr:hypothetical protein [Endomicrobiales bacterium]